MEFMLLEDCCEILDSLRIPITASDREKGIYPYYGANGIQDYVSSYIFDDDLVLLAEDGGSFGSKTKPIAYRVSGKCWVNNHAHVLKPKEGMDVDFLCYSLMFYNTDGLVNGATRQKLTQSAMRKMKIPKLHIDVQQNIVKEIKYVKSIIEIRGKQLEKLSLLVKARFVEMFGGMVLNTNVWDKYQLGDLCDVRDGTHDSPQYYNEGYPLVTSKNVSGGNINLKDCNLICEDDYQKINQRSKVDYGDILMPMIGTVGNPVIVDLDPQFAIKNVALIKFRKESKVLNSFVKVLLESDYFDNTVISKVRGGTQKFISLSDIRKLEICLPPIEVQKSFEVFTNQVNKSKFPNLHNLKSIYTKPQLCCKMVVVNDFLNTKRF